MKLYHGTAERHLAGILQHGIRPRGKRGTSNWKETVPSNPDFVYLTNAYAIYFAGQAIKQRERLAVVEIETAKLDLLDLHPDEDVLEQGTRREGPAPLDKSMPYRTRWYRRRLREFQPYWTASLEKMGTCTHDGPIAAEAITRIATLDFATYTKLIMYGMDPTITILNYHIVGARYRNFLRWLFGDDLEADLDRHPAQLDLGDALAKLDRSGVEVQTINHGRIDNEHRPATIAPAC